MESKELQIIRATPENIGEMAMCGYNNPKNEGYRLKREWAAGQMKLGARFWFLVHPEQGAIGSLEAMPGEHAWRPVDAPGYMFVQCIYIMKKEGKERGYGRAMLEACKEDARRSGKKGVASLARKGSWMAKPEFFGAAGFRLIEKAKPDFMLMALKFDHGEKDPKLIHNKAEKYGNGLHLLVARQCPYTQKAIEEIPAVAQKEFGLECQVHELHTAAQAQQAPGMYGTFALLHNGRLLTDNPISKTRFVNIMKKEWP